MDICMYSKNVPSLWFDRVVAPARETRRTLAADRALVTGRRRQWRVVQVRAPAVALVRVHDSGHRVPHRLARVISECRQPRQERQDIQSNAGSRAWHVTVAGVRGRRRAVPVARGAEALVAVLHTREGVAAVAAEGDAGRGRVAVRELVVFGRRKDATGCVDRAAVCGGPAGWKGDRWSRGRRRRCARGRDRQAGVVRRQGRGRPGSCRRARGHGRRLVMRWRSWPSRLKFMTGHTGQSIGI
jgi:hypothetical protein